MNNEEIVINPTALKAAQTANDKAIAALRTHIDRLANVAPVLKDGWNSASNHKYLKSFDEYNMKLIKVNSLLTTCKEDIEFAISEYDKARSKIEAENI